MLTRPKKKTLARAYACQRSRWPAPRDRRQGQAADAPQ
ncbi:hypothetical protein DVDV_0317 [Desulfovibrio sp. DV]|nr:hypothetical protein DVDV_0317 [Desulfovibrio sp. DV]